MHSPNPRIPISLTYKQNSNKQNKVRINGKRLRWLEFNIWNSLFLSFTAHALCILSVPKAIDLGILLYISFLDGSDVSKGNLMEEIYSCHLPKKSQRWWHVYRYSPCLTQQETLSSGTNKFIEGTEQISRKNLKL